MKYTLLYLDKLGSLTESERDISYLAFTKHLAFAGMGIGLHPPMFFRFLGYFFEFRQYWDKNPNSFTLPAIIKNDPTEINYISNRIGRAIADHLCKTILGARFTHSYEDSMVRRGFAVAGERPDFYCDTLTQQFAVEAKGYSKKTVSENEMLQHKQQLQSGRIPVNFTMASVAFNLYAKPTVKFYDPTNDDIAYADAENMQLRSIYYRGIIELIDLLGRDRSGELYNDYYSYYIPFFDNESIRMLVHRAIVRNEYRTNGWLEQIVDREISDDYFIDRDGIGLHYV